MIDSKYKHIIWDWNGTLFNDVDFCRKIINKILITENLKPLSINEYRNIFTFPVKEYYRKAGLDFSKTPFEVLGKIFMDEYEVQKYSCDLFNGTIELLKLINEKGIEQSILSAYKQDNLLDILDNYSIKRYFKFIVGLDNIYAGGKAELGLKLMDMIGIDKSQILFIGDTLHDAEVASLMDVDSVLLSIGHQAKEKLINNGSIVLDNLNELPKIIWNSN